MLRCVYGLYIGPCNVARGNLDVTLYCEVINYGSARLALLDSRTGLCQSSQVTVLACGLMTGHVHWLISGVTQGFSSL